MLFISIFGWNWLRGPIENKAQQETGRTLQIQGDLSIQLDWPVLQLRAAGVNFANPPWAKEPQMLVAEGVEVALEITPLLSRKIVLPLVRLSRATVFLEHNPDGRKSWLLDLNQQDESARINIGRIALEQGTLGYDDTRQKTSVRAALSTATSPTVGSTAGPTPHDLKFVAKGMFNGLALTAQGSGGPVLALRDTQAPYPLKLNAKIGQTHVQLDGSVTGLLTLSAVDMRMALRGASLEQLYPLLGIAFPATPAYVTQGHLTRLGPTWRYEKFSGRIGSSDIAGFVQIVSGGQRPQLSADLNSQLLSLDDLGTVIGARNDGATVASTKPAVPGRVLPDLPFNSERWGSVDAEVQLQAKTIRRAKALPLENLTVHLSMRDSVLTLDPLKFAVAHGQLSARISLDGRSKPIKAHALVRARKILIAEFLPTVDLSKSSFGQINGEFDLSGTGNSVGSMLASSNGKLGLVVAGGQISKLLMEKAGLHLWEILTLSLTGDRLVKLRCAVADFDVKQGKMQTAALVLDTQVTTLFGTGNIDLGQETLDLTLNQKTKATSPVALRSPIYVRGSFAKPRVEIDKVQITARAVGAVVLGMVNPLLALIPLVDMGPGQDSDCGQLVRDARVWPRAGKRPTPPANKR